MSNHTLSTLPESIQLLIEERLKEYNHAMFEAYALTKHEIYEQLEIELHAQRILMYHTILIFSIVIGAFFSFIIWCRKKQKKRTR